MDINEFIKNFAIQFDDTEIAEFKAETNFRELDEWSSLISLAVLNMVEKKYGVKVLFSDLREISTIQQLYSFVEKNKNE
jgi:acyl carrier protein